jgi:regulator of CtrA degradation
MSDPEHSKAKRSDPDTIAFGDKLASSDAFMSLFREGMTLIEETASYLDGPGRADSRDLSRTGALAYATESMRLTTRLMQLASWLLLQRAVNEGELTKDQAKADKMKMKVGGLGASEFTPAVAELPDALKALVERSLRLQERIVHLDRLLYVEQDDTREQADSPLGKDLARIAAAFGKR